MFQHIQIFPHPLIDGTVTPLHRIVGLQDHAVLQHIIRNQDAPGRQESENIRQKTDILGFGRIHENEVIDFFPALLQEPLQRGGRILLQKLHAAAPRGRRDILSGLHQPLLIILNRGDLCVRRRKRSHQKGGKTDCGSDLQYSGRLFQFQEKLQKTLHLLADNRNPLPGSFCLKSIQIRTVSRIQRVKKSDQSLVIYHSRVFSYLSEYRFRNPLPVTLPLP